MKKKKLIIGLTCLALITCGIAYALIAGANALSLASVKEQMDNSSVKISVNACTATTVEFTIINNSEQSYVTVGKDYIIYSKVGMKWKEVKCENDVTWDEIAYMVYEQQAMSINWNDTYGSLEKGEYLLAKECHIDGNKEIIYAEFEIK